MRALLRDSEDQALRVVEVNELGYDAENMDLWVSTPDNDFIIKDITAVDASYIQMNLFRDGKVDLSDKVSIIEE